MTDKNTIDLAYTQMQVPYYTQFMPPLPADLPAHALLTYVFRATSAHKSFHELHYIGEGDPVPDYKMIFKNIAAVYQVDPNDMDKYWIVIERLNLTIPPLVRNPLSGIGEIYRVR